MADEQGQSTLIDPKNSPGDAGADEAVDPPTAVEAAITSASAAVLAAIRSAVDQVLEDVAGQQRPNGPGLWATISRDATAVLRRFVENRQITGFRLLCDARNNDPNAATPVLDIWIRLPKRVGEVIIRTAPPRL